MKLTHKQRAAALAFLATVDDERLAAYTWQSASVVAETIDADTAEVCALYCDSVVAGSQERLDAGADPEGHAAHNVKFYTYDAQRIRLIHAMKAEG